MPESGSIDFPNEADKGAALEKFHGTMRASEARLKSVSPEGARWCALHRRRIPSHRFEHRRRPTLASFRLELVEWMAPG
jgi:hypothetical protein